MRLRLGCMMVALASIPLLGACGAANPNAFSNEQGFSTDSQARSVLRVAIRDYPPTLDPQLSDDLVTLAVVSPVYNGLLYYTLEDNARVAPELAEEWDILDNGTRYVFHLRDDAKFHDGSPFTAADAAASLQRIYLSPDPPASSRAELLPRVSTVRVTGSHTLEVVLSQPSASFLPMLAQGWNVMMRDPVARGFSDLSQGPVIGTGPFVFRSARPGEGVVLERNPAYWRPNQPRLDGIAFPVIQDREAMLAAFQTGQVDLIAPASPGLTAEEAQRLVAAMGQKVTISRIESLERVGAWINTDSGPLKTPEVRRALSIGLDRVALAAASPSGSAVAGGFLPPAGDWMEDQKALSSRPGFQNGGRGNLGTALAILKEGLLTPVEPLRILVPQGQLLAATAQALRGQMEALGVTVDLAVLSPDALREAVDLGDFSLALAWTRVPAADPSALLRVWRSSDPMNLSRYASRDVNANLAVIDLTTDQGRRRNAVSQAVDMLWSDLPYLPLYWEGTLSAWNSRVLGYGAPFGPYNQYRYETITVAH